MSTCTPCITFSPYHYIFLTLNTGTSLHPIRSGMISVKKSIWDPVVCIRECSPTRVCTFGEFFTAFNFDSYQWWVDHGLLV